MPSLHASPPPMSPQAQTRAVNLPPTTALDVPETPLMMASDNIKPASAFTSPSSSGRFLATSYQQAVLRASTKASSGFNLSRHSSPSSGSDQLCSYSNPPEDIRIGRWCTFRFCKREELSAEMASSREQAWHSKTLPGAIVRFQPTTIAWTGIPLTHVGVG